MLNRRHVRVPFSEVYSTLRRAPRFWLPEALDEDLTPTDFLRYQIYERNYFILLSVTYFTKRTTELFDA